MSYFYRNVNAVISPELTRELVLSPGALGLLTAVYFVAFAAMQIPAGMLLDRYGPRRVEPALLLVAGGVAGIKGGHHVRYPNRTPMANLLLTMMDKANVPHVESLGDGTGRLELPTT